MPDGYSWSDVREDNTYHLPGPDHIGGWAVAALILSVLLHIGVFFALDRMKVALQFEQARELSTAAIDTRRMEVRPMEDELPVPPEEILTPPDDAAALLEEIDILQALPDNTEIDIKTDVDEAEYALQMQAPLASGDPSAVAMELSNNLEIDSDLPELGRDPETIKPAEIGQLTVDPGAVEDSVDDLGKLTEDLLKKGAGGVASQGAMDGIASLDDLLDLPKNVLLSKKTLLPSDLLFDYNSAKLRESAKVGLMKLGLLMDLNPDLFCWIEGHTDLVGGDEFNLDLSIRRAEAVRSYLVESLRMDEKRIHTRGFGRFEPLVIEGNSEQQAVNRRVEIRMRKTPPNQEQMRIAPKRAEVVQPAPTTQAPPPPKPVLVKPLRALPIEEPPATPPRAAPVPEPMPELVPPRASPVEPPRKAIPIEG